MATEGSQEQRWLIEKLFGQSVCGEARLQTEFAFGTNVLSFFFFFFLLAKLCAKCTKQRVDV